ncbi:MAG: TGS domain-containing protein, partial [bacterium]
DIGDHASAARINGKFMAIDHHLKNGDVVEIEIKKTSRPTTKWLEHAKTTIARKHIVSSLQNQETISERVYKFFKPKK